MDETPEIRMLRDKITEKRNQLASTMEEFQQVRLRVAAISQDIARLQKELFERGAAGETTPKDLGSPPEADGDKTIELDRTDG